MLCFVHVFHRVNNCLQEYGYTKVFSQLADSLTIVAILPEFRTFYVQTFFKLLSKMLNSGEIDSRIV